MKNTSMSLLVIALIAGAGCQSQSLVFVTATQTGIEVNAVEGGQQHAHIGYRRFEGVVMPYKRKNGTVLTNAFPVASMYELNSGSLLLPSLASETNSRFAPLSIRQVFVTGRASTNAGIIRAIRTDFEGLKTNP